MRTDDLYLLFQPIVNVETSTTNVAKVDEYEVLLRSYKTDIFPSDEFHFILSHEEYYIIFMNWFSEKLEEKLNQHPEIVLSVNF
ncbi:MAG TPA: EAL domain-containing protein, partial [Streptococcus sp.]|nr:EAL domain-containing protein [Streptococcus sp.]